MNKQSSQIGAGCLGCGALLAIVLSCVATGGVPYFNSEVERWEQNRADDIRDGNEFIVVIDDHAIEENTTSMYASGGCACCAGFIGLLGIGGAVGLFLRSRKAEA